MHYPVKGKIQWRAYVNEPLGCTHSDKFLKRDHELPRMTVLLK
jgi:hypothetical protein